LYPSYPAYLAYLSYLFLGAGTACGAPPRPSEPVTVFAAASLKTALDALLTPCGGGAGVPFRISYAASSTLARQIEEGAEADLFISADLDWMDYVGQKGQVMPGTRVDLLRNSLVLIAPASSKSTQKIGPGFPLAAALGSGKLAMANPDSVPAGKYGRSALEHLGVWGSVEKQVARAENVRAALALVSRSEAPYGIVYATDAFADKGVRIVDTFPAASHPPIVYPAAIVASSKSPAAKPLLEFLKSAPAKATWEKYGFLLAQ
jgi:molybdate transport system substrate-binding protein